MFAKVTFKHSFFGPPINARGVKKGSKREMGAKKVCQEASKYEKKLGIPSFFDDTSGDNGFSGERP